MEYVLIIFLFIVMTMITGMLFVVWCAAAAVKLVVGGVRAIFQSPDPVSMPMINRGIVCPNEHCRALSEENARFCRRCGGALPQPQRVTARRVAMW